MLKPSRSFQTIFRQTVPIQKLRFKKRRFVLSLMLALGKPASPIRNYRKPKKSPLHITHYLQRNYSEHEV